MTIAVRSDSNHSRSGNPATLARSNHSAARLRAATDPDADADTLHHLAGDSDPTVRIAVASNPATPPRVLTLMALVDTDPRVTKTVWDRIVDPDTDGDTLDLLAQHADGHRADRLLSHPNLTDDGVRTLWDRLAGSPHGPVRSIARQVADHTNCPGDVLDVVYAQTKALRPTVAAHPNCPAATIIDAATGRSTSLRRAAASNPNAPADALDLLALSDEPDILQQVVDHPNATDDARAYASLATTF